jgi:hypothetical protein
MGRAEYEQRAQAWAAFHEWERSHPPEVGSFGELVSWLDEALGLARRAGALVEEDPEHKATRIARLRVALAAIRPPT